jgi:hypothetical protein
VNEDRYSSKRMAFAMICRDTILSENLNFFEPLIDPFLLQRKACDPRVYAPIESV